MQNPALDIITRGGQVVNQSLAGVSASLANASNAISQAGSIAVKLDIYLQNEEARKKQEVIQAQQMLNNTIQSMIQNNMAEKQLALQQKQYDRHIYEFDKNFDFTQKKYNDDAELRRLDVKKKQIDIANNIAKPFVSKHETNIKSLSEIQKSLSDKIKNLGILADTPTGFKLKADLQKVSQAINNEKIAINNIYKQVYTDQGLRLPENFNGATITNNNNTQLDGSTFALPEPTSNVQQGGSQVGSFSEVFVTNHSYPVASTTTKTQQMKNYINMQTAKRGVVYNLLSQSIKAMQSKNPTQFSAGVQKFVQTVNSLNLYDKNIDYSQIAETFADLKTNNPKAYSQALGKLGQETSNRIKQLVSAQKTFDKIPEIVNQNFDKSKEYYQAFTGVPTSEVSITELADYFTTLQKTLFNQYGIDAVDKLFKGDLISSRWGSIGSDALNLFFGKRSPIDVNAIEASKAREVPEEVRTSFVKNTVKDGKFQEWEDKYQLYQVIKEWLKAGSKTEVGNVGNHWYNTVTTKDQKLYKKIFGKSLKDADVNDLKYLANEIFDMEHSSLYDNEKMSYWIHKQVNKSNILKNVGYKKDSGLDSFYYFVLLPASLKSARITRLKYQK